jgi:type I restriction enzyme M protein
MNAPQIVQKLWNYCDVLRDDGLSYGDYVEQLTFLLFLKMADERVALGESRVVPKGYDWPSLMKEQGEALEAQYRTILAHLATKQGMLGLIFRKSQNKIQDPAKLARVVRELIGQEQWLELGADVKGDAYEGLLEKNAQDVKGGAGQYFTPRALIEAIVAVTDPKPGEVILDPACGTGGFLLAAYQHLAAKQLDRDQKRHLSRKALRGVELVDGVVRLCAMNMLLHGVGSMDADGDLPVVRADSLSTAYRPAVRVVLTNPPFGRSSSVTFTTEDDELCNDALTVVREDFWAETRNKQLNFLQHIVTCLEIHGRAAVILPDNVLFEGGAGEKIRRKLLATCDLHTILRLPTGIFYAQGVKANVLFFERKPAAEAAWTKRVWFYDLRTGSTFTPKQNPLRRAHLDEFIACYKTADRGARRATWSEKSPKGRWRSYGYDELVARDKCNLDVTWLSEDGDGDDGAGLDPSAIARSIIDDVQSALAGFAELEAGLKHVRAEPRP